MKLAPVKMLRGLDHDRIENIAGEAASGMINDMLLATENKDDIVNAITFLSALGGEFLAKLTSTIVANEHKNKGKSQAVCEELVNVAAADFGVRIAEVAREHINDMFNGKATEKQHKVRRD